MSGAVTSGMDIAAVRQLATEMKANADQIRTIKDTLTSKLDGVAWVGPDYQKFDSDWKGTHVQQLVAVITALEEASQTALRNANEQEATSSR